jgi:hypothetical protein
MRAPRSTAATCSRSSRTASKRSTRLGPRARDDPRARRRRGFGLAWAEGTLWVGRYRERKIHQIDPQSGAVLRTIESNRFVTGVTWVDGELWHGTWEADESALRRVDPGTGHVLEQVDMPAGVGVSGLESDGRDTFYCGGGNSGTLRAVRRPRRGTPCTTATPTPTQQPNADTPAIAPRPHAHHVHPGAGMNKTPSLDPR